MAALKTRSVAGQARCVKIPHAGYAALLPRGCRPAGMSFILWNSIGLYSHPNGGGRDLLETFFTRSCIIERLRKGPLAGHIDLLADRFAIYGFSRVHSRIQLRLVGHFNRWLDQKGISAKQIDEDLIERYWHYFERKKRVRAFDVGALLRLLELLREQGITPRRSIEVAPTLG